MARERFLTWPNRLTMLRIVLIAPFVVLLMNIQTPGWAGIARRGALLIFGMMAVSDLLDGYLARRLNQESPVGRFLDPLADKLLITCAMILLGVSTTAVPGFQLPNWVVVSAIGKDLFVIVGFIVVFIITGDVLIRPAWAGKMCTMSQMVLVVVVLTGPDVNRLGVAAEHVLEMLQRGLWVASAALAVLTCWQYFRIGMRYVNRVTTDPSAESR